MTRRILGCRWRSVITVLVMGKLSGDLLAFAAVSLAILGLAGRDAFRALLDMLLNRP
jgi:hypothetical protein